MKKKIKKLDSNHDLCKCGKIKYKRAKRCWECFCSKNNSQLGHWENKY
jgi:hypothetical protein